MPPRLPSTVLALLLASCARVARPPAPAPAPTPGTGRPSAPTALAEGHSEVLGPWHDLGGGLLCGGQPRGQAGFEELVHRGVRTVVSVDGTLPDVDAARQVGLRYVHVPVGYDGIPEPQRLRLIRAVRESGGPVYIHCHHGRHRGPAATAAVARALRGWSAGTAAAWMKAAGTDLRYAGLYRDAERSFPVPPEVLARDRSPLPERVEAPPRVQAMVAAEAELDALKHRRGAAFAGEVPDPVAAAAALRLAELFQESARTGPSTSAPLRQDLEAAASEARSLSDLLARGTPTDARESGFGKVVSRCSDCHRRHRDNPGSP